ncbi:Lrp/AsnC family transcriptional regulator [Candidatus Woesearchaeota archaeon]|nr:Lrp/AsnC family transcriptional regulator [Candidatus Woesearchaeota archaeon]
MKTKTQKQLLLSLRRNGRAKLSEISRDTGIPTTTLFEHLKQFSAGCVRKYVPLVDWQSCGFGIRVAGAIKAKQSSKEKLQEFLSSSKSINSLQRINNNLDFFFEALFPMIKDFEEFNENLRSMSAKLKTFFIVEAVREEHLFTEKGHLGLM